MFSTKLLGCRLHFVHPRADGDAKESGITIAIVTTGAARDHGS